MTARQLLDRARECQACGREHKRRDSGKSAAPSWADPDDGHAYRPWLQPGAVAVLEQLLAAA